VAKCDRDPTVNGVVSPTSCHNQQSVFALQHFRDS
jgi:hypothetical protein